MSDTPVKATFNTSFMLPAGTSNLIDAAKTQTTTVLTAHGLVDDPAVPASFSFNVTGDNDIAVSVFVSVTQTPAS